jgi:hypothetical protein
MGRAPSQLVDGAAVVEFTIEGATMLLQRPNSTTLALCCTLGLLVGIVLLATAVY